MQQIDSQWRALRARDRQLVARCLAGDEGAWTQLWQHYGPLVKAVAHRQGCDREECRDVLQRVALVALEKLATLKDHAKLGGWLATVARFQSLDVVRGRSSAAEIFDHSATIRGTQEEELQRAQELTMVRRALLALDERCRRIITRLDLSEPAHSYQKVAADEGLAATSIGPIRRRCLERLRKFLEKMSR